MSSGDTNSKDPWVWVKKGTFGPEALTGRRKKRKIICTPLEKRSPNSQQAPSTRIKKKLFCFSFSFLLLFALLVKNAMIRYYVDLDASGCSDEMSEKVIDVIQETRFEGSYQTRENVCEGPRAFKVGDAFRSIWAPPGYNVQTTKGLQNLGTHWGRFWDSCLVCVTSLSVFRWRQVAQIKTSVGQESLRGDRARATRVSGPIKEISSQLFFLEANFFFFLRFHSRASKLSLQRCARKRTQFFARAASVRVSFKMLARLFVCYS